MSGESRGADSTQRDTPVCSDCGGSGYQTAPPVDITEPDYWWTCGTCEGEGVVAQPTQRAWRAGAVPVPPSGVSDEELEAALYAAFRAGFVEASDQVVRGAEDEAHVRLAFALWFAGRADAR